MGFGEGIPPPEGDEIIPRESVAAPWISEVSPALWGGI